MKILTCLGLFCFSLCLASATPLPQEPPFVTCYLMGQLGNQLFQVATTLAYAWDYGAVPLFPRLNDADYRLRENRDQFFFRLNASSLPRPHASFFQGALDCGVENAEKIPFQRDLLLYGGFQSWKLFAHHKDELLEVFAPSEEVGAHLKERYSLLLEEKNTVAVHVRTFNSWLHHSKRHPFLGLEYYAKAMALFPAEAIFVIFSDRIGWCKRYFPLLGRRCIFIEGNTAVQDFHLMASLKHQIIGNSSFSWWAAYLNRNPHKIVVAPTSLMHPDLNPFPMTQPNDFYLPEWILVSPDYRAPYPRDMTWYDTTTSLDGN